MLGLVLHVINRKTESSVLNWSKKCCCDIHPIIDLILNHTEGYGRPYLRVKVLGIEILRLFDSGASKTIVGSVCWKFLHSLGLKLDTSKRTTCREANGEMCEVLGECLVTVHG